MFGRLCFFGIAEAPGSPLPDEEAAGASQPRSRSQKNRLRKRCPLRRTGLLPPTTESLTKPFRQQMGLISWNARMTRNRAAVLG